MAVVSGKNIPIGIAKEECLKLLAAGRTVAQATAAVGRAATTHDQWMFKDPAYKAEVERIRAARAAAKERGAEASAKYAMMSFAEFRKEFLGVDTYRHQQAWVDVIEGKDYTPVPGETWEPGKNRKRILINTPPSHPAHVDTPIITRDGWKTVGEVTLDDWLLGGDGEFWPIYDTWESPDEVDLYEVEFETGDVIRVDANHIWWVTKTFTGATAEMTTRELMDDLRWDNKARTIKWKVPVAKAFDAPDADLPLDPYLLGYWLGDGSRAGATLTVCNEDMPSLLGHLDSLGLTYSTRGDSRSPDTTQVVYVRKIRHLLPLGDKRIPDAYFTASYKQRLALLQGLMDTDGSINPKDGRAYFCQTKDDLTGDVYRLIASLGLKPSLKVERQTGAAPNGYQSSEFSNRIYFKPNGDPVFRLERKASRQKVTTSRCKTNYRTIRDIRQVGRGKVRCLSVVSPGNLFALGDGCILSHNAKTTTITIDYVTYRICLNPNIRVIVVSKTQAMAKKFLYAIKKRLTDRQFAHLQAVFAPEGGFKGTGEWSQNRIYVGHADSGEKDPTVEALGIGGQIYGVRADLIILDDVADVGNAHEFEKQITWLTQDVESRIKGGTVIVVGTRVGVQDIYSELMNGERYLSGTSPWTRLAQPAVLRYADDPADWVTLWPYSSTPHDQFESGDEQDGQYVMWDGPALSLVRESKSAKIWALVYQQQSYSAEDQTFRPTCVWGSVDRRRKPGPLTAGGWGHPRDGGQGMYTIAAMDPAMTGDTFTVVGKVDRSTQQRWIENAFVQPSPSTQYFRDVIKRVTVEYGVNEWVIEKNAFQLYLIRDPEITNFLASRGVKLTPHYSGNNKSDPDFGVASVAPLFGSTRRINEGSGREVFNKDNLIELPDPDYSQGIKTLVEELLTWVPGKRGKDLRQDGPMALWFLELRARQVLGFGRDNKPPQQHMPIPFLSRGRAARRAVTPPPLRGLRPQFEEVNVA